MKPNVTVGACALAAAFLAAALPGSARAADVGAPDNPTAKFAQLGSRLPTPNTYRNAAGAPGHEYWQQRADYVIDVTLDEDKRRITGRETIRYTNASPDTLPYLWLQLDQNRFRADSLEQRSQAASKSDEGGDRISYGAMRKHQSISANDHGHRITSVTGPGNRALPYTIVDTMMRIDLPKPLGPGQKFEFSVAWSFDIVEEAAVGARGGYEFFEESDTNIFFLAQWFPRMVAYTDYTAWQHKQFLGRGEFTLEFGDYDVAITVPADHIVAATGELTNPRDVLTVAQRRRLEEARDADKPVFIVPPEDARANERDRAVETSTWRFEADNVRDFAWASSRKFIWDAMGHRQDDDANPVVMAYSFYPIEAEPIWSQYSTEAVVHTMEVYSRFSFPYPYPTAQSVNTWKTGGMEYPMITFNGYRPEPDEEHDNALTYSRATKHSLIGVIIHEIGHIYFPMTVNSDERRWTWMDEGINSFLEYLAELEWEENFHSDREAISVLDHIGAYMVSDNQVPIMTQSDSILQFGPNAYTKPTAALVVLRETVMGRELFDFAFREYARRWRFKRPTPADLFRTMEDASAMDLDWFWHGWFYTTDHVDVNLAGMRQYRVSTENPDVELAEKRRLDEILTREPIEQRRNREEGRTPRIERVEGLRDFYNEHDRYTPSNEDRNDYQEFLDELEEWERDVLAKAIQDDDYLYFVDFENVGGLLTPLPLAITYADGSAERLDIPAEIWRRNSGTVTKLLIRAKPIIAVELDPDHQTADVDRSNNHFPRRVLPSRLQLYKDDDEARDLMRGMLEELKGPDKTSADGDAEPMSARDGG